MPKPNPNFVIFPQSDSFQIEGDFHCSSNAFWTIKGDTPSVIVKIGEAEILLFGDLINPEILNVSAFELNSFLSKAKGHFTVIVVESNQIKIATSYFSFLPVYFLSNKRVFANHWKCIRHFSEKVVDEQYLLESHLFNYPIADRTLYQDIKVLRSFTSLSLDECDVQQHEQVDVGSWFPKVADKKMNLKKLSEHFIKSCKSYFTNEEELITFTSGFDGRTILATALANGSKVHAFSMGRMENDDVYNPLANAKDLNIPFDPIDLGSEKYVETVFHNSSTMSISSGGRNGFLYPHFQFCASHYRRYSVLHTGYCGSELFRALHIAGAVTSREMVAIFLESDEIALENILKNSPRLTLLQPELVERCMPQLIVDIASLRSQKEQFQNTNHFFYYFIFKEVFRKVFGFWTNAQFEFLKVRTPFLDFDFVQRLLQSEYAGCNNAFFTHNPLKRYKGQLLYAQILKTLHSPLFKMMTGKNYCPNQLLSISGQISIVLPYLKKKWRKKRVKPNIDNLGLITGFQISLPLVIKNLSNVDSYYTMESLMDELNKMHPTMQEVKRDMLFQIASLSLTLKDDEVGCPNGL